MQTPARVLYLHGFLSSPQSQKAQQTIRYCEEIGLGGNMIVPTMEHGPAQTMAELEQIIQSHGHEQMVLLGSSLGGFYATYLADKYAMPAALINPAVRPFELWESYLGEHRNYYSDHIHLVTENHVQELLQLDRPALSQPENFMVLVQTGDETLDYRQAVEKFRDSCLVIRENGNHSYENYEAELPSIFEFLLSRIA